MSEGSLNNHLLINGRYLPWKTRFNKVFDLSPALLYLHEESKKCVLHYDIKSPNVMLDSKCKTMLGDLGAALLYHQPDLALQTRKMVGKFGYVAPGFSYQGRAAADERLDMDFSKHEMDFSKHEMDFSKQGHPIAKQRPKISQAKLEVLMTNLSFEMPPFISGIQALDSEESSHPFTTFET
uniref:Protein kinase domain-containing protein n=1 Tax=Salix viminalis TaxID=40686 RepID=A0A6N2K2T7_SALVM